MTVPRQSLWYKYTSACAYAPYRSLNLTTHICHTAVLYRQRNYRGIWWVYPRYDPTLEGTLRNNPSPPPGSTLNIKSSMSCFPHTLLRTNVTLHVIRRKETTPKLAIRARMRWRVLSLCSRCGTLGRSFSRSRPQPLVRSLERRVWLWTFRLPSAWKRSVSRWSSLLSGHWTSWPACRRCASEGYTSPSERRCSNRPTAVTFARPCSCWGFWQADPPPRTLCALGLRWRRRKPGECQRVAHPSGQNLLLSTLMASSVWQCGEVDWRWGLSGRGRRWGTVCAVRQDIQYPCCSDCVLCWLEWLQTVVRRFWSSEKGLLPGPLVMAVRAHPHFQALGWCLARRVQVPLFLHHVGPLRPQEKQE